MNKIKVIDLLNMISKGEEVPKKIKLDNYKFQYNKTFEQYYNKYATNLLEHILDYNYSGLNNEVEIIEEEKEIEFEDIESFGIHYSWDYIDYKSIEELKKYVNKDFQNIFDTLDKLIKNQKKIIDVINDMRDKEC